MRINLIFVRILRSFTFTLLSFPDSLNEIDLSYNNCEKQYHICFQIFWDPMIPVLTREFNMTFRTGERWCFSKYRPMTFWSRPGPIPMSVIPLPLSWGTICFVVSWLDPDSQVGSEHSFEEWLKWLYYCYWPIIAEVLFASLLIYWSDHCGAQLRGQIPHVEAFWAEKQINNCSK